MRGLEFATSGRTRLRCAFELTGAAVLLTPDFPRAPVPKVSFFPRVPHSASALSPHQAPRPGSRTKKAPEARGETWGRERRRKIGRKPAPPPKNEQRGHGTPEHDQAQGPGITEDEGQNMQKRRTKGGPPLPKTRKNAEGLRSHAAGIRRAELRPVQELFALRITSSDAAMMSASAHHCRPESTSPRMRNPNSAAAAGSRLMSTP